MYQKIFNLLYKHYGPQHWWPGDTPIEIIVGAILTQNTNWKNVEKAIINLKDNGALTVEALHNIAVDSLAELIRPAGYFNVKAKRLKNFIHFVYTEFDGNLELMRKESLKDLRSKLLTVNGIGPETADSIILYAFDKPSFVIDAYTKRIFTRHHLVPEDIDYHGLQDEFQSSLEADTQVFNEYHALIVQTAKDYCKTKPDCENCPLNVLFD